MPLGVTQGAGDTVRAVTEANPTVVCAYHNVGYRCLQELLRQGADVQLVFTHEDSPTEEIWFHSVRELARRHRIPCITSDINTPENIQRVKEIAPDFLLSFYYRNMIDRTALSLAAKGALNLHGSLLPRYRGRVPVNWAIINGEKETGATLHYMVEKPDAGDIVDQERVEIAFTDTALDLFHKVTEAAVMVISRSWPKLVSGTAPRIPMDLAAGNYCRGRKPVDGRIDWTRSATEIYNLIRGVTHPYPGAYTEMNGIALFIWQSWPVAGTGAPGRVVGLEPLLVGTGDGLLEIRRAQLAGAEEMSSSDFIKSAQLSDCYFI